MRSMWLSTGKKPCGTPLAAVGAGGRPVGVDHIGDEARKGLHCQSGPLSAGRATWNSWPVLPVGVVNAWPPFSPYRSSAAHLVGDQPPVPHHARAHLDDHRMPPRGAEPRTVLPGCIPTDRQASGDRQVGADVLDQHPCLLPNPPPNHAVLIADALDRQPRPQGARACGGHRTAPACSSSKGRIAVRRTSSQ